MTTGWFSRGGGIFPYVPMRRYVYAHFVPKKESYALVKVVLYASALHTWCV